MNIIKVGTDNKVSLHQYPEGGYNVTHKFLTDLIGNGCDTVEEVRPVFLYDYWDISDDPYSGKSVVMLVDEDGRLKANELNGLGSFLYGAMVHGEPIVGNVVFVGIQVTEDGLDFGGIDEEVFDYLQGKINEMMEGVFA